MSGAAGLSTGGSSTAVPLTVRRPLSAFGLLPSCAGVSVSAVGWLCRARPRVDSLVAWLGLETQ